MARVAKQKLARESTAAFSASQPLLTALHASTSGQLDQQTASLTEARDLVKSLHVKLPDLDSASVQHSLKHERYMDCIVQAFREASATYTAIFSELVNITAEDPTEGRGASKGHAEFKAMLEISRNAKLLGAQWTTGEEARSKMKPPSPSAEHSSAASGTDTDDTGPGGISLSANAKLASRKRSRSSEDDSFRKAAEPRQKSQKLQNGAPATSVKPPTTSSRPQSKPAHVDGASKIQYQDITEEVNARLKAKEAEKQAKASRRKEDKKRKRDSGVSDVRADEPQREATVVERPKKKKHRKGSVGDDAVKDNRTQTSVNEENLPNIADEKDGKGRKHEKNAHGLDGETVNGKHAKKEKRKNDGVVAADEMDGSAKAFKKRKKNKD